MWWSIANPMLHGMRPLDWIKGGNAKNLLKRIKGALQYGGQEVDTKGNKEKRGIAQGVGGEEGRENPSEEVSGSGKEGWKTG
jgi:hypothetical protein